MKPTEDEGYIIRCTDRKDGHVSYLRLSKGNHYLCGMFGPCFKTREDAEKEMAYFLEVMGCVHDADVVRVTLNVEDP